MGENLKKKDVPEISQARFCWRQFGGYLLITCWSPVAWLVGCPDCAGFIQARNSWAKPLLPWDLECCRCHVGIPVQPALMAGIAERSTQGGQDLHSIFTRKSNTTNSNACIYWYKYIYIVDIWSIWLKRNNRILIFMTLQLPRLDAEKEVNLTGPGKKKCFRFVVDSWGLH